MFRASALLTFRHVHITASQRESFVSVCMQMFLRATNHYYSTVHVRNGKKNTIVERSCTCKSACANQFGKPDSIVKYATTHLLQPQSVCRVTGVAVMTVSCSSNQNVLVVNVTPIDFRLPQPDQARLHIDVVMYCVISTMHVAITQR